MKQMKKEHIELEIVGASKQEVKEVIVAAFKDAFSQTGVSAKDFTWFSNKTLKN